MEEIKSLVQYFIDGRYLDLIASPSIYQNLFAAVAENTPVSNDDSKDDKSKNATNVDKASNTISGVRDIYRASVALRERCATFLQSVKRNVSSADDDAKMIVQMEKSNCAVSYAQHESVASWRCIIKLVRAGKLDWSNQFEERCCW